MVTDVVVRDLPQHDRHDQIALEGFIKMIEVAKEKPAHQNGELMRIPVIEIFRNQVCRGAASRGALGFDGFGLFYAATPDH